MLTIEGGTGYDCLKRRRRGRFPIHISPDSQSQAPQHQPWECQGFSLLEATSEKLREHAYANTNFTGQRMAAVSHFAHRCANPYALNPDADCTAHASATLGVLLAGLQWNRKRNVVSQPRKSKISSEMLFQHWIQMLAFE